jgi:FkbM family methyltransferase
MRRLLSRLIPGRVKPWLRGFLGIPDLEAAHQRLYAAGFRPTAVVDIGAFNGGWAQLCRRTFPGTPILMVEPQVDRQAALRAVAAELGEVTLVSALLGPETKSAVSFYQDETVSSVLPEEGGSKVTVTLPMLTLDQVLAETQFPAPNFLKLDVQGYELAVLAGGQQTLARAEVVLMEINLIAINRGAPLLHEAVAYMAERGFRVYDICSAIRRPLDEALWQTDMIFVRQDSALVGSTRWR